MKSTLFVRVIGLVVAVSLVSVSFAWRAADRPKAVVSDVLVDSDNLLVTMLSQDCESVRMALGAALDDGQACRAYAGYLRSWTVDDRRDDAEELFKWGNRMFEQLYAIDHGILSVRFARDSRDEPKLNRGASKANSYQPVMLIPITLACWDCISIRYILSIGRPSAESAFI